MTSAILGPSLGVPHRVPAARADIRQGRRCLPLKHVPEQDIQHPGTRQG
jgi:hypothetical protein